MTDQGDIDERAVLLPEEQAGAGQIDPELQAEAILADSQERTENEAVGIREDNVASESDG